MKSQKNIPKPEDLPVALAKLMGWEGHVEEDGITRWNTGRDITYQWFPHMRRDDSRLAIGACLSAGLIDEYVDNLIIELGGMKAVPLANIIREQALATPLQESMAAWKTLTKARETP